MKFIKLTCRSLVCSVLLAAMISHSAYADATSTGDVSQIAGFIKSVIEALAGLSGMVATGYFMVGGFSYITSSGNPQRLEKAKRTILYSAIGLSITIAAFVISNIVSNLASSAFGS